MSRHWNRKRSEPPTGKKLASRERDYVILKEAWRINHPQATQREYEVAMLDIARRLKL